MDKATKLQIEGKGDRAKGRAQRAAGALSGNKRLEVQGLLSEAKGQVKETAGTVAGSGLVARAKTRARGAAEAVSSKLRGKH